MTADPLPPAGGCDSPCGTPEPLSGSYFVSTYPPFSTWTAAATAGYREHLERPGAADRPLGLYVHIPFCVDRCDYCYYLSNDDRLGDMDGYLDAVIAELDLYGDRPALAGRRPDFVYFGGGTPSLLSTARIERLLPALQRRLPWSDAQEVTFECAPRSVTAGKLRALRDHGVTRISLGVQAMDDAVLRANGRVHLTADVARAFEQVRSVGFPVVNLDLIVGLVGETDASFEASLQRVFDLAPDTITAYQLEIPWNTPLWRTIRAQGAPDDLADWDTKRRRLQRARQRMAAAGYRPTSAYTAMRDPLQQRFVYQDEQYRGADLLGIGASAFSHLGGWNQQNRTSIGDYVADLAAGRLPLYRAYRLDDTERMVREFILQLKLGGCDARYFRDKFAVDLRTAFAGPLAECQAAGWLTVDDSGVQVTDTGILRIDRLLPAFYLPAHLGVRYS